MSSITAIFGSSAEKATAQDDERLKDLYWNRIELKKEFAGLRTEKFKLTDRLKTQQGDIARLEQKLEHLESLLTDPDWARSIMVLYQLRGLSYRCERKVARFAEQLKQQREQKQNSEALGKWRAGIEVECGAIAAEVKTLREQVFKHEEELQSVHRSIEDSPGLFRYFKRRSLQSRAEELAAEIQAFESTEEAKRAETEAIQSREPPETLGLGLAVKRSINFMILSYAQQLYLSFDDDGLVSLVKEASEKSAGAIRYGDDRDCESIVKRIRRSETLLEQGGDFAAVMQKRAKLISEGAIYKNPDDTVPVPGTVATLFRIDSNDVVRASDCDLLSRNFWGLANVMSR
ncbi:MAG: hypothetical protein AAGA44_16415 [Pseudomonadota bacterium]